MVSFAFNGTSGGYVGGVIIGCQMVTSEEIGSGLFLHSMGHQVAFKIFQSRGVFAETWKF